MRTILGRLADLGLPQLFKLLTSSGAQGVLELDTVGGRAELVLRDDRVAGEVPTSVLVACRARAGTFRFRPQDVGEMKRWATVDELLTSLDAAASEGSRTLAADADPLTDLRDSLTEVALPEAIIRIAVVSADPRPYRAMEIDWRTRGWQLGVTSAPQWPEGPAPDALIVHLPTSVTLVGQERGWLDLAREAAARKPRVPVLWIGGLVDPWLRHQAIMAGVSFLLPAPVGEVGETARWFREEVTALVDGIVSGRLSGAPAEDEAFRDFFVALHMDASPAEVRASLLRVAGGSFDAGLLLAVRDGGFEPLGSYGVSVPVSPRLGRGDAVLEEVVARCLPISVDAEGTPACLATTLGSAASGDIRLLPILAGQECVAIFVGARPRRPEAGSAGLRDLLARAGPMLGV
jgi:hypothetical protein